MRRLQKLRDSGVLCMYYIKRESVRIRVTVKSVSIRRTKTKKSNDINETTGAITQQTSQTESEIIEGMVIEIDNLTH